MHREEAFDMNIEYVDFIKSIDFWSIDTAVYFLSGLLILAVVRNWYGIITVGSIALGLYSYLSLNNLLFAELQGLIAFSAFLLFLKISKFKCSIAIVVTTIVIFSHLITEDAITDLVSFIGASGLFGIAVGLISPKTLRYIAMIFGGALLTFYSYQQVGAEVFLFLNISFTLINLGLLLLMRVRGRR